MTCTIKTSTTPITTTFELTTSDDILTMSSIEIAKVTGKPHPIVMREIMKMIADLNEGHNSKFGGVHENAYGRKQKCYYLPRREADIYFSECSMPLRTTVIDHWRKLEEEESLKKLSHALNQEIQAWTTAGYIQELEQEIFDNAYKVNLHDLLFSTENLFDADEFGKLNNTGRTRILTYLREHKILMRSGYKRNRPYQKYIDAGLFVLKLLPYKDRKTGTIKLKSMPLLTGKGLIWLQQFIAQNGRTGL